MKKIRVWVSRDASGLAIWFSKPSIPRDETFFDAGGGDENEGFEIRYFPGEKIKMRQCRAFDLVPVKEGKRK